jgi:hypothetical protein
VNRLPAAARALSNIIGNADPQGGADARALPRRRPRPGVSCCEPAARDAKARSLYDDLRNDGRALAAAGAVSFVLGC